MRFHTRLVKDGVSQFSTGSGPDKNGPEGHQRLPVSCGLCRLRQLISRAASGGAHGRFAGGDNAITQNLVRVPLGWQNIDDSMFRDANPAEPAIDELPSDSQAVEELRS